MTEKEKMQAGEWFSPNDEELVRDRARARHLTHRLNVALKDKDATYLATLRELCPRVEAMIRAPFHCDYGYNISIGKGSYVNFNCVFLDLGPIRLGQRCLIGPGIGAGSVVTHDIPDDSVAAGNPARVIRTATDE